MHAYTRQFAHTCTKSYKFYVAIDRNTIFAQMMVCVVVSQVTTEREEVEEMTKKLETEQKENKKVCS